MIGKRWYIQKLVKTEAKGSNWGGGNRENRVAKVNSIWPNSRNNVLGPSENFGGWMQDVKCQRPSFQVVHSPVGRDHM